MTNERYFVQMKSFSDIGKENHPSLETYIMAHSPYLRDGSESFPMNTQPVSHLHTQECQVSGLHKPPFALGQPSGIYSGLVTPPPGCSGMPAPSFQAQLLRHVWRIREDSKQLHRAGS